MQAVLENPAQEGLRSRKKAETRRAIQQAALRVATENGYSATTAIAIAEEANVSLRTVFNYFPQRDQAICGPTIEMKDPELVRQQLADAPPSCKGYWKPSIRMLHRLTAPTQHSVGPSSSPLPSCCICTTRQLTDSRWI